jgi:L-alanine-DL-glutamate epimerase-like enolase superfamily enzyme
VPAIAPLHVCVSIPNVFRQTFRLQDVPWRDTVFDRRLMVSGGLFRLDDRPGFGFDPLEGKLERNRGVYAPRTGFCI